VEAHDLHSDHTTEPRQAPPQRARGQFAIFTAKPNGKTPLTEHGCKDATRDPAQIAAWQERWPTCNWAIATGTPSGNLLVVDVDGIWEAPGDAWTDLANSIGGLPRTVTVLSGSGHSMHWYFLVPDGVTLGNTAGKLAPGIDTRCEGGYVICPPSIHPAGERYVWVLSPLDVPIAPLPVGLLDLLRPAQRSTPTAPLRIARHNNPVAARILDEECNRVAAATEGTRNMTTFSASAAIGNLVAGGDLIEAEATAALSAAASLNGLPPWEATAAVLNGIQTGMTTPRSYRRQA
jgi:hypothetical protein